MQISLLVPKERPMSTEIFRSERSTRRRTGSRRLAAVAVAAAMLGAMGCSGSGEAADSNSLEIWTRSRADAAKTYEKVFAAFTEETGINVDFKALPADFDTQLQSRAAEKDLPDAFVNDAGSLGQYESQGYLAKIDQSKVTGAEQVDASIWGEAKGTDGEVYGVPWSRQAVILAIRKDWREKLGLPQPKTWQDLDAMADAFATKDPDGNGKADTSGMVVPGTASDGYIARWATPYLYQAGGEILAENGGKYTSVVNSSENQQALTWIRDQFCTPGHVAPGSINLSTADAKAFEDGTAGLYLTGAYYFNRFDAAVGKENVEVVEMPKGPDNNMSWAEGENLYLGSTSKKTEQLNKLASFMVSEKAQTLGMDPTPEGDDPASHNSVVRLPVNSTIDAGEVYNDPRWATTQEAYKNSKRYPWNFNFIPFRNDLADGINAIAANCQSDIPGELAKIDKSFAAQLSDQGLG